MATVYLHIGVTKTASSSIQVFLADNRDVLKQHDIAYPDFGYPLLSPESRKNARFFIEPAVTEDGKKTFTIPSPHYAEGLDKTAELGKEYGRIILSDEGIWKNSGRRPDFWPQLKQDLDERGLDVRIIVYLRRQDLWLQSHWQQNIKEGISTQTFQEFLDNAKETGFPYDFGTYLDELADIFGKEAICVRVFEKGQFKGEEGSIYSDFLDVLGLSCEGFCIDEERSNPSMRGGALEIKRILNTLPKEVRHERDEQDVKNALLDLSVPEKTTLFASTEAQKAFLAQFEDSNRHVACDYLGRADGVLFYEPVEDLPVQTFDPADLLHDTILVYGQALYTLERQNKALTKEVDELKQKVADLGLSKKERRKKEQAAQ